MDLACLSAAVRWLPQAGPDRQASQRARSLGWPETRPASLEDRVVCTQNEAQVAETKSLVSCSGAGDVSRPIQVWLGQSLPGSCRNAWNRSEHLHAAGIPLALLCLRRVPCISPGGPVRGREVTAAPGTVQRTCHCSWRWAGISSCPQEISLEWLSCWSFSLALWNRLDLSYFPSLPFFF